MNEKTTGKSTYQKINMGFMPPWIITRKRGTRERVLCMPVNTLESMGAYGRKFLYCPMCGKKLEAEHD